MKTLLTILLAFCVIFWYTSPTQAEHTDELKWMMQYNSATGMGCCSEPDCTREEVAIDTIITEDVTATSDDDVIYTRKEERAHVHINGKMFSIPLASVHISEDSHTWVCLKTPSTGLIESNLRCVFYLIGG